METYDAIDDILNDELLRSVAAPSELSESEAPTEAEKAPAEPPRRGSDRSRRPRKERREKVRGKTHPVLKFFLRLFTVLLVTLLLAVAALYGVMYVLAKGPSPTAQRLFVRSVRETSAAYFLADWFFTPEEIEEIENSGGTNELPEETDVSLVQIREPDAGPQPTDEYGLTDDDGDGIIVEPVSGPGFVGYMMVVLDPTRMMFGSPDYFGGVGLLVSEMVEKNDCVAGVNGGGFLDINGQGNGGTPIGMTIVDGQIYYGYEGSTYTFVGFDDSYILHTGQMTPADAREKNIQFGCTFGPVLVSNGEPVSSTTLASGVNPRTAIGQRADGAVLLLVIEGRQAHSIGATFADLSDLMVQYGAVNACNLDGGGSSVMWYNGEYIISSISFVGERPVATAFLVKKEGA
ncbi:MAG: phosphodiester glycosidase family protein [Butyricicoccus sp.]|nr:phosphodiester glycosidase family protein [Butyricicoccus sp.]